MQRLVLERKLGEAKNKLMAKEESIYFDAMRIDLACEEDIKDFFKRKDFLFAIVFLFCACITYNDHASLFSQMIVILRLIFKRKYSYDEVQQAVACLKNVFLCFNYDIKHHVESIINIMRKLKVRSKRDIKVRYAFPQ